MQEESWFINGMKVTKCKNMCNYAKNNVHANSLQKTARGACDKKRFCEEGFPTFASDTLETGDSKTWVVPTSIKTQPGNNLYSKFPVAKYSCAKTANSPFGHLFCQSTGINYLFRGTGEQVTVKVKGPLRIDDCGGPLQVYKLIEASSENTSSYFYCFNDVYHSISKAEINWVAEAGVDYIVQVSGIDDGSFTIAVDVDMPSIYPWFYPGSVPSSIPTNSMQGLVPSGVPSSIPANMPSSIPNFVE